MGELRYLTALVCLAAAAAVVLLTLGAPARPSRAAEETTGVITGQHNVSEALSRLPTSLQTARRDRVRRPQSAHPRGSARIARRPGHRNTGECRHRDPRAAGGVAAPAQASMSGASAAITIAVTCELDERAFSVTDALQACIDHAPPGSAVEIPRGVYRLDRQIVISTPLTDADRRQRRRWCHMPVGARQVRTPDGRRGTLRRLRAAARARHVIRDARAHRDRREPPRPSVDACRRGVPGRTQHRQVSTPA